MAQSSAVVLKLYSTWLTAPDRPCNEKEVGRREQTITHRDAPLPGIDQSGSVQQVLLSAGELDKAIPLHERALAERERLVALDDPDTRLTRNNLSKPDLLSLRKDLTFAYRSADDKYAWATLPREFSVSLWFAPAVRSLSERACSNRGIARPTCPCSRR